MDSLSSRLAALSVEKRALLERRLQTQRPRPAADYIAPFQRAQRPPLSFAQQRLWFLEQLEPEHSFYNLPFTARLSGPLAVQMIERALNEIVRRHEALRTTFVLEDGAPVQIIAEELKIDLEVIDLRSTLEEDREAEGERRVMDAAMQPFDLERGPLFRAKLFRLTESDHILLLIMHHIVTDGWSMGVLYRELTSLYSVFCNGLNSPLADLPMQYGDFASWQRDYLSGERLDRLLSYWKRKLDGIPALMELPTDRQRPRIQSFQGAAYMSPYPKQTLDAFNAISREADVTLFMSLLTVFKILLNRYGGVTDVVVGAPIANRNRVEFESIIGFFVNTLVLRTDLSGDPTVRAVLSQVREVALEAFAHQDLPFERLVEELQPDRNLSHNPLFQVMFGLQNTETTVAPRNGRAQLSFGTSKFDLTLSVSETAEGLTGIFEFNTELFDASTVVSLANTFGALLDAAAANPDLTIGNLPLLTRGERAQLIETAATPGSAPRALLVSDLFELQEQRTPEAVAATYCGAALTYESLNARANQLARALRDRGVGIDVLVGLCMDRSLDFAIGMIGVLKAGAAFVPLDPGYPSERLSYMMSDSNARILLTQSHLVDVLPRSSVEVWCLDRDWPRIATCSEGPLEPIASPDNLAYVIYTSGSTGRPKGVMVPNRCVCYSAQAQIETFALAPNCRVLQFGSLSFDTSIYDLLMAIGCGGTLCLAPQDSLLPGPPLAQTLREEQVNIMTIPPSALGVVPETPLPHLHTLVSGGEAPSRELAARWGVGRRFFNAYGPTETTIWATVSECMDANTTPKMGRAIANMQAYVLNPSSDPAPINWMGEVYLGGAGVARGYLNRPALTAERYVPDPFSSTPSARLYRTGDLGRLTPNKEIQFFGRADQQLKLRGYRIEMGEIEATLLRHPAVREAAAVVQRTPADETRIAAYCVVQDGQSTDRLELLSYLRDHLPGFMIPASLRVLNALPLNANGKLDRVKLSLWIETVIKPESEMTAPSTEVEEAILRIFREVLEQERIGVNDSFFESGGHSLLATRVITRINESLGIALPLRHLFEFTTAKELAAAVDQARGLGSGSSQPPITRAVRQMVVSGPATIAED